MGGCTGWETGMGDCAGLVTGMGVCACCVDVGCTSWTVGVLFETVGCCDVTG